MADTDEIRELKALIKAGNDQLEALKHDLETLQIEFDEHYLKYMNTLLDIGQVRDGVKDNDKSISKVSNYAAERFVEFRERIMALETCVFGAGSNLHNTNDGLKEIHRIIGPPDTDTPSALDKPPEPPRRK